MASSITPSQVRYNDPYQNTIFDYNTPDSKVYLSRESNSILKAIGNNLVLNGLTLTPTFSGSTVYVNVGKGFAIHDLTLLELTSNINSVDINVATLADTPIGGCHLAVFTSYQYIQTVEPNLMYLKIFHINSSGIIDAPDGMFNAVSDLILLGVINFTKSGTNVINSSLANIGSMSINGITYYNRGYDPNNMNLSGLITGAIESSTVLQEIKSDLLKYDYLMSE